MSRDPTLNSLVPNSQEPLAEQAGRVVEDWQRGRFELRSSAGELLSFADFRSDQDVVVIPHVETPVHHRGEGHAGRLMAGLLEILERTDRRLRPLCTYAARYVRERPEHHHLLADGSRGR